MRDVQVDLSLVKGKHCKFFNECAGVGRAYLILRRDLQEHIAMAARECGFKYLRFHGLFQDDIGIYREDRNGNPIYSWQYLDAVYDTILDIGLRPFLVFDFMPEKLASGYNTVYWEKANITPPIDYIKWENLIYEVVKHFTERYGYDEVKQWFFEVWNEPDHTEHYFFTGGLNDYLKLYECTARAVKSVSPDYRVGGPAIAGDIKWIDSLIEYCCNKDVPIDFISAHTYSVKAFSEKDTVLKSARDPDTKEEIPAWNPGIPWPQGNLCYDPEVAVNNIDRVNYAVKTSRKPELDIYFTEWGLTYDYWDPLRDSYHAASYILSILKSVRGNIKAMSYCEISDVFEEDGPPTGHFHGGFGLVNLQGIRKPAYFAYKFLNQLGDTELECNDQNTIACFDSGSLQVLFWDYTVRQDRENKNYYNQDNPSLPIGKVRLLITGLKPGDYYVEIHCTGYRRNDAYSYYLDMRSSGSLSRKEISLLDALSGDLPMNSARITIKGPEDVYCSEIDMRENDVYMITLKQLT